MSLKRVKAAAAARMLIGLLLTAATWRVSAVQTLILDTAAGGKRFDGIGAVSGGGATSVLLKDYPEPQRSQILDLLFKPKFGASMSALFVEIPGDGNSTQGSELSHMHTRNDLNCRRGYEWWLMGEAKERNPAITLDGVAWGCPGWVGNGHFWSQDMCDYYVKWIQGLKQVYGLDFNAIGCRNERGVNVDFVKMLRRTLDQNRLAGVKIHAFDNWGKSKWDWCSQLESDPALRRAVDIIGNHTMSEVPTPEAIKKLADRLGKPIWDTEEHVYKKGYDCEISLVHAFNENYISNDVTKVICWYLISAFYPVEPFFNVSVMVAGSPWSGHYTVNPALWAYAHYGQFCRVGWKYLNGGCANLAAGGSVVTLTSGDDYSMIAETQGAKAGQELKVRIRGALSRGRLCVWRSNPEEQFVRLEDVTPVNGEFSIRLEPDSIYSLSTTSGQRKGGFANVPGPAPFPFPYRETFDEYTHPEAWGYQPHYTADICGGFEIAERPDGRGKCLRQVVARKAQSWAPEWMPYTILGDSDWKNYEVSADIYLDDGGWAGVMGRISSTGNGWGCNPKGYYARLYENGEVALYAADTRHNGAPGKKLATGRVSGFSSNQWNNLKLRFDGAKITAFVNGAVVLSVEDTACPAGVAGLVTGGENDARNTALFDNLTINRVDAAQPKATIFSKALLPMYQQGGVRIAQPDGPTVRAGSPAPSSAGSPVVAPTSTPAATAAKYLDRFTSGSMAIKQAWDLASAAINSGDFASAQSALEELQARHDLTPAQRQAVSETTAAVQAAMRQVKP